MGHAVPGAARAAAAPGCSTAATHGAGTRYGRAVMHPDSTSPMAGLITLRLYTCLEACVPLCHPPYPSHNAPLAPAPAPTPSHNSSAPTPPPPPQVASPSPASHHTHSPPSPAPARTPLHPAGKYLVELVLERDECPEGWQPDPITGAIPLPPHDLTPPSPGSYPTRPVAWKLTFLPSADDRVCPITVDTSLQNYFKQLQEAWGAAKAPPVPVPAGGKAPPKPSPPKAGAPIGGGARSAAAAALLEKVTVELGRGKAASAAGEGIGGTPSPLAKPSRAIPNGTLLELRPEQHFLRKEGESVYIGEEQLLLRAEAGAGQQGASAQVRRRGGSARGGQRSNTLMEALLSFKIKGAGCPQCCTVSFCIYSVLTAWPAKHHVHKPCCNKASGRDKSCVAKNQTCTSAVTYWI